MNLSTIRTNVLNSLYKGQGNTTKSLAYRNCLALVGLYLAKDLYSHFNIAQSKIVRCFANRYRDSG